MEEVIDKEEGCNHDAMDEKLLSERLNKKLEKLPSLFSERSIFRAPAGLRDGNEKAFTPQVISIGPIHHYTEKLNSMEELKMQFFKDFLSRARRSVDDCLQLMKEKQEQLQNCYADIKIHINDLIEIILVDAAFIVEVLLRSSSPNNRKNQHDHFFSRPGKVRSIKSDMLLLENQVPFFIIVDLLSLCNPPMDDVRRLAIKMSHEFFQKRMYLVDTNSFNIEEKLGGSEIKHFVDLVRTCHLPPSMPRCRRLMSLTIPTATKLRQAGIKFKLRERGDHFDIQFKDKEGVLEIPRLKIYDTTASFLRNAIAYEDYHLNDTYMNDFAFILDRLIDTPSDVELLMENGIIESKLSSSHEVASVINSLSPGILMREGSYFADLCEKLNDYYKAPWHKWRATLKQNYFSNPWAIISVIAASVLLVLTFVQTLYSVISFYHIS